MKHDLEELIESWNLYVPKGKEITSFSGVWNKIEQQQKKNKTLVWLSAASFTLLLLLNILGMRNSYLSETNHQDKSELIEYYNLNQSVNPYK